MKIFKDFKEFAFKGNVVDLAVGVIIGVAFGAVVKSLVDDILMPVLGMLLGKVDLSKRYIFIKHGSVDPGGNVTVANARESGAVIVTYGQFLNAIINFLLIAFAVFLLVKAFERAKRPKNVPAGTPTIKDCPYCCQTIPVKATRCPQCTSQLPTAVPGVQTPTEP